MSERDPKKFDPARAHLLDAPERDAFLPDEPLVDLLELTGGETVVDYGAGTGRVALAVARRLGGGGRVVAVDESPEMVERLERATERTPVEALLIRHNQVPLEDGVADRVLAVNLLHEVRGESALAEMHRLLAPGGLLLVADWERGRERPSGPPDRILYSAEEALRELAAAGLRAERAAAGFPYHYALRARKEQSCTT